MNKVVTINLSGNAHQLEEAGYDALRSYLEIAERNLAGNPDREEILADIERAIAGKCRMALGPNRNVVSARTMQTILDEMGEVESDPASAGGTPEPEPRGPGPEAAIRPVRRLYRISEGRMLGGVCNGLAAYFDVDVTLIRLIAVLLVIPLGVLSLGSGLLIYVILCVVVPNAESASELAAAHGTPGTAGEVLRLARQGYYETGRTTPPVDARRIAKLTLIAILVILAFVLLPQVITLLLQTSFSIWNALSSVLARSWGPFGFPMVFFAGRGTRIAWSLVALLTLVAVVLILSRGRRR